MPNQNNGTNRSSKIDHLIDSAIRTPRSCSWSREHENMRLTQSARSPRSKSMIRTKHDIEAEEKERRENADSAFREWLKRKSSEPRTPRASPSREQISRHLRDEARQRVINQWHNNRKFQKSIESYVKNNDAENNPTKTL